MHLPDIQANIMGIKIILSEIKLKDFDAPKFQFQFMNNYAIIKIVDLQIDFMFQFRVIQ